MPKKRKLIIKATGAGDPTFFLKINIPLINGESSGDTLNLTISAVINANTTALAYNGNEMPLIPLGIDVDFASNFLTLGSNDTDLSVAITFESPDFDFELEAPINMHATSNGNTISVPSVPIIQTGNITLEASNKLVMQTLENHENGNLVYLNQYEDYLVTKSIFSTQDDHFVWLINLVNGTLDQYTIENESTGKFLAITSSNGIGLVNSGSCSECQWSFQKVDQNISKYQISIIQNGESYFLHSDATNQQVSLTQNSSSWYLFIR